MKTSYYEMDLLSVLISNEEINFMYLIIWFGDTNNQRNQTISNVNIIEILVLL